MTGLDSVANRLPLFPLPGSLLLPRTDLPLHIFEPRYRSMLQDILDGPRMLGMIQPREGVGPSGQPAVYQTGCLGRVSSYQQTDDGRYLVVLNGICRFTIRHELPVTETGYRVVIPSFESYLEDLCPPTPGFLMRDPFFAKLRSYAKARHLVVQWDALRTAEDEELINSIAMSAPLEASEKQALLEANNPTVRAQMLSAMFDMAVHAQAMQPSRWLH